MRTNGLEYLDAEIEDSGVIPLSKLGIGNWKESPYAGINVERQFRNQIANIGDRVGIYDNTQGISNIGNLTDEQLQDALYNAQTGTEMVGNALKGMAAIAGTTYVSNTLGLANILLEGTWDNTVNNYMAELENTARERWQVYRPSDYEEKSFLEKLGDGVFWADLVQNMGFTLGAGAAAATFTAIPGMNVLGKAPSIVQKAVPSLFSAIGEASIEAVHHKNTETEAKQANAIQQYTKMMASAKTPAAQDLLRNNYEQTLLDIEEDERKAGNFVFGANTALLTLSNTIEFGDIFARGFGTGRRVANSARKAAQETIEDTAFAPLKQFSKAGAVAKGAAIGLGKQLAEAGEEVSQGIITKAASANEDYNSFNNSKFNPEKREVVSGMMQSLIQGFSESMHDPNTAVEAAMGFFTGALGMPRLKKSIMPVSLEGGILGSIRNEVKEVNDLNRVIDNINNRLKNDKELTSYYEGLVRHLTYQDAEDTALEDGNHKNFADANSAKFISDIMMFDKVGRLDMLESIIDSASNLSDEDVQSLIKETTTNGEGPFTKNGNFLSSEEVKNVLREKTKSLKDKIKEYNKLKEGLTTDYPALSEDSLEQAMFYQMQYNDLEKRNIAMGKEFLEVLQTIAKQEMFISEDKSKKLSEAISGLTAENIWANIGNKTNNLAKTIDSVFDSSDYNISADIRNQKNNLIKDFTSNIQDMTEYSKSFSKVILNPEKENKKHQDFREKLQNKAQVDEHKAQQESKVNNITEKSTGEIAGEIFEGEFDFKDALAAIDEVGGEAATENKSKVEEAKNIANTVRNQVGTATTQGAIDRVEGATEEQKNDAKAFMIYAGKNVGSRDDVLNSITFTQMTTEQVAESLGLDPSIFLTEDTASLEQQLEDRKNAALAVIGESLKEGIKNIEEAQGMSADLRTPDERSKIGRDPVAPVHSIKNAPKRFSSGEKVLGVDISDLTLEEALDKLQASREIEHSTKEGVTTSKIIDSIAGRKITKSVGVLVNPVSIKEEYIPEDFQGEIRVHTFRKDSSGKTAGNVTFIPNEGQPFERSVVFKNSDVYDSVVTTDMGTQDYKNYLKLQLEKRLSKNTNTTSPRSAQRASEASPDSKVTQSSQNDWATGFEYSYRGDDPKYKGLTSKQVLEQRIKVLSDKQNLSNEDNQLLNELNYELAVRKYLEENGVYSVPRQKMVQVGTKLNFVVKPEFPKTVFVTVIDPAGNHAIVGALRPTAAASVLRRYKTKWKADTMYVESNVSTVTQKRIGRLNTWQSQQSLSSITNRKFKLAIDLSSEGDTYADIRTLADSRKESKTESERNIRPPKRSNAGNSYILVNTSLVGEGEYITAGITASVYNENDDIAPAKFIKRIQSSSASLDTKLNLLQEILDVDIRPDNMSMSLGDGVNKNYTVRSKGRGGNEERTVYGKISGNEHAIFQQILDLISGKVPYTVSRKYINSTIVGEDYNSLMAPVLTTNLVSLETIGDFFTMSPVLPDGTESLGKRTSEIKPSNNKPAEIMLSANEMEITQGNNTYFVDTLNWTVAQISKDGNRIKLNRDTNTALVNPLLATAYLAKEGVYTGIGNTPWGLYNIKKGNFISIGAANAALLSPILDSARVNSVRSKIQALLQYENIRSNINNSDVDAYIAEVRKEVDKNYNYYSAEEILDTFAKEKGRGPIIEVSNYVENPSMEEGEEAVLEIKQTAIFSKGDNNLLQPAKIVIVRGPLKQKIDTSYAKEVGQDNAANKEIIDSIQNLGFSDVYNSLTEETKQQLINFLLSKKKAIRTRFINQKLAEAKAKPTDEIDSFISNIVKPKETKARTITFKPSFKAIDIQKEVAWLYKVLPQVSKEDRVNIVKGLIRIARKENSEEAWGAFKDGIIYISDNAAEGTVYHEAFHLVLDTLLSPKEVAKIFAEAKQKYNTNDLFELEELLAEDFRRYITYNISEQQGWLKTMWERLKNLIKYVMGKMTYIDRVYYNINNGVYKNRKTKEFLETRYRKLTADDMLNTLDSVTYRRIKEAHTSNKELTKRAKEIVKNRPKNTLYLYDDLVGMFKQIPGYQEVVQFKEVKGRYKPVFYADMTTTNTIKELDSFEESVIAYENQNSDRGNSTVRSISMSDYISKLAFLESELAQFTQDEKDSIEDSAYEEDLFLDRERVRTKRMSFGDLSEEIKESMLNSGRTQKEYEAFSNSEKEILLHCFGI